MTTPATEPAFATLFELLAAVGYPCDREDDVESSVEDYAHGYIDEDVGENLFVTVSQGEEGQWMSLRAAMSFYTDDAVVMWTLDAPFTVSAFHRYLDELDLRIARLRAIIELPTTGGASDGDSEDQISIVTGLAALFGTDEETVVSQFGDDWLPIEGAAVGTFSISVRYLLWNNRLILGLDDEFGHVFVPTRVDGKVDIGDLVTSFELGDSTTIAFSELARALRDALLIGRREDQ